jgi:hypothetical protein
MKEGESMIYTVSSAILQLVGAGFLCYIIVRLGINARRICNRKRHPVRHGVSSRESVIETMEGK